MNYGHGTLAGRQEVLNRYTKEVDHHRITKISTEMPGLLEQQKRLLDDMPFANLSPEDVHKHGERNQRLRDLCTELMKS